MENDNQIFLMLGRLEGKLDASLSGIARIESKQDEHELRITSLEETRSRGTGALASLRWGYVVIAAAAGLFAQDIRSLFTS
jgi:hypothetical protein